MKKAKTNSNVLITLRNVKKTKDDYYYCPRCKINTIDNKGMMIPCPRGGCEAEIRGAIKTTITTDTELFDKKFVKKLNKQPASSGIDLKMFNFEKKRIKKAKKKI